ncbi:MAG: FAD-dependent oxidoreductase [Chloroflexota bacterium]|nr:FAD-dependent oxidoreductase [Chloroflexota bacterium]
MASRERINVVVLGGGYAGTTAALRLSRKTRGSDVDITLINDADHFVERIRLHQLAANQLLKQYDYVTLLKGTDVHFEQGWVTDLSPANQMVTVRANRGEIEIGYDYLIYALGSTVDTHSVPGVSDHALSLSTEETTAALQEQLPGLAAQGGRLLVCGGGLTGIEAASELAEAYPSLRVTLVTSGTFGEQLSQDGQQHLRRVFDRLGIEVIDGQTIARVHPHSVECHDGTTLPFDMCLWAGAFAVSPLARDSGLPVNQRGQVLVDGHLRVKGLPNLYAIGDAASLEEALDIPIRMGCVTAAPMGTYVGNHLAATIRGERQPKPYHFRYFMRCISLGRHDALVQFVEADDTPKERILTGWIGAQVKEVIVRSSIWSIEFEQKMASLFRGSDQAPAVDVRVVEQIENKDANTHVQRFVRER